VAIVGKFDKWDAELTFKSPELSTGVLDIKIHAATVDTGNAVKNGKLKRQRFLRCREKSADHVSLNKG
jgi:polyisoprenoid-binding protein YceI